MIKIIIYPKINKTKLKFKIPNQIIIIQKIFKFNNNNLTTLKTILKKQQLLLIVFIN